MDIYNGMDLAISLADQAAQAGEVPVGCVISRGNEILASRHNECEALENPLAHAEMLALGDLFFQGYGNLKDTTLFVTLEPCPMCAGAIALARIPRVVFGAYDPERGAANGASAILGPSKAEVLGGIREKACQEMLSGFFSGLRVKSNKSNKSDRSNKSDKVHKS